MLSAMFIVFPLFCGFCLIRNRVIQLCIALYVSITYYANIDTVVCAGFPYGMIRVFCGMVLGALVYYAVEELNKTEINSKVENSFLPLVILILCLAIGIAYFQFEVRRIQLWAFLIALFLCFSSHCKLVNANIITNHLGQLSMIMYITHYPIALFIAKKCNVHNSIEAFLLYYGITIAVALILYILIEKCQKRIR